MTRKEVPVDIQAYTDFLNHTYDQLLERAQTRGVAVSALLGDYLGEGGELEKALGTLKKVLSESFLQYLRLVVLVAFNNARQVCQDQQQQARYDFFMSFTNRLIQLQSSAAEEVNTPLRDKLVQALQPLLRHHRTLIRASMVDLSVSSDNRRSEMPRLLQSAFWPQLTGIKEEVRTAYQQAYEQVSEDTVVTDQKKQQLEALAVEHFVHFCQLLAGLAADFYRAGTNDIAHVVKQVVVAYDKFFAAISTALCEWIGCCQYQSDSDEVVAAQIAAELGHLLKDVASELSEHQYSFLTRLAQGVAGIAFSRSDVDRDERGFYSCCYTTIFVTVLSIQTNQFDAQLKCLVAKMAEVHEHETETVLNQLDTDVYAVLRRAQKSRRDGLIAVLALSVIFSPFIVLVVRHYRKQSERLERYRVQAKTQLRQSLSAVVGGMRQKRNSAVDSLIRDPQLHALGVFQSGRALTRNLRAWAHLRAA